MNKWILIFTIVISFTVPNANAARDTEIEDYNRISNLAFASLKAQSYVSAYRHLDKASKLGNKVAQYSLALLYMSGNGVEEDYTKAYFWLNVASEVKEKKWRALRDKIENSLSQEQKTALKPFVDEYINKYGAVAQEISCRKRFKTGSHIKRMTCSKMQD